MFSSNSTDVSATAAANYIEDVFSTYLYTGNGSTQTITNGIDLAGKGGLVWLKRRNLSQSHGLFDTARGENPYLDTDLASGQLDAGNGVFYTSNGFTNKADSYFGGSGDGSGYNYASWTFRKQPKFFDVVTYTGNGANRTIAHSLDSVPGCIIVKRTDTTGDWQVYHRSNANTQYMVLNSAAAVATGATRWNSTTPTSTVFSLGTDATVNASGGTYVAYLFAHNAGGFGLTGTDNVISCGSFTTGASGITTVDLGYEPQYLLFKVSSTSGDWVDLDNMRGFSMTQNNILSPNTSAAEEAWGNGYVKPTATGFTADSSWIGPSRTFIYIAIRRGPMKVPTSGTSVFAPVARNGTGAFGTVYAGINPDLVMDARRNDSTTIKPFYDKLRGTSIYVSSTSTAAETTQGPTYDLTGWTNTGYTIGYNAGTHFNQSGGTYVDYVFQRAPSFFDEVCYTGTGVARTVTHNLGVAPEMYIIKRRDGTGTNWVIYSAYLATPNDKNLYFTTAGESTNANIWSSPTSTTFGIGTGLQSAAALNANGFNYVAYLFASCPGVSKVGSYTGTGATQTISCGFTGGARFVLIKRTDSTGDWYVWDTARGMVSGTDPSLLLNSTAAEVNANSIYTTTGGFQIVSTAAGINASGGTYIYLAIA